MTDRELIERARQVHSRFRETYDAAGTNDQKLIALGNYGEIALSLLPEMAAAIEANQ